MLRIGRGQEFPLFGSRILRENSHAVLEGEDLSKKGKWPGQAGVSEANYRRAGLSPRPRHLPPGHQTRQHPTGVLQSPAFRFGRLQHCEIRRLRGIDDSESNRNHGLHSTGNLWRKFAISCQSRPVFSWVRVLLYPYDKGPSLRFL